MPVASTTVLFFALATLLQTATPGPGVLYVSARSLAHGRRAGFASAFGIEFGEVIWLAATATGLVALLSASTEVLTVLRFAGAAYLIYLGVQRWRSAEPVTSPQAASHRWTFVQGTVTQLLNPKVAVYFVAFMPLFLDQHHPIAPQVAVLGVVYVAVALAVDATYVLAASTISRRFVASLGAQRRSARIAAGTYVALGLAAAAVGERPV